MSEKKDKSCLFAGTFDPPTLGHKALVEECLKLFDKVVVAILVNPAKVPYFTLEQREEMLGLMFGKNRRVRVIVSDRTVTELMKKEDVDFYVRGIRNSIDLDYENANFYASRKLDPDFSTVYLPCPQELLHVSSSIVRNSLRFSTSIDEYVTAEVKEYIEKLKK